MGLFLFPDEYYSSTYDIDFRRYYKRGYRAVFFDIDNTLVEHDAPADERSIRLIKKLKAMGFKVCFISNNKEPRVASFNKFMGADYVFKAGKPKADGYIEGMKKVHVGRKRTLFVGDQIFTDIWGANNAGLHSILVKQIAFKEEIQIYLKRIIEWPIVLVFKLTHPFDVH